jgi:hypothetical protein
MLSMKTLNITPALTSAPKSAVRRSSSSVPPVISASPANIVYAGEAPMNVHSRPIIDAWP